MKRQESIAINSKINNIKKECIDLLVDTDTNKGISTVALKIRDMNNFITAQVDACRKEISALSKEYNPSTIAGEQRELRTNLNSAIEEVKKTARDLITECATAERNRVNKMVGTPPTQEQLSLLSSLSMRKNISDSELAIIAESVADNYQATRILSDIAKAQGCYLSAPIREIDDMTDAIDKSADYLTRATEYIDTPMKQIPESRRFFFRINPKEPQTIYDPHFTEFSDVLDGAKDLRAVKVEKTGLNAAEKVKVAEYMDAVKNEDITTDTGKMKVMKQIETVLAEHPDDIGLMRLSDYKDTVKSVERVRAMRVDKSDPAKRHFNNTGSLISYINDATKGLSGDSKEKRVDSILSSLPKQQRYAYDYYQTYGEVVNADNSGTDDTGSGSDGE
jgi:hypothetical protein